MAEPNTSIRGLTQRFGDHEVLRGIDMVIFRGERLAILGGSGCGKSVLIKHLPGLLRPTSGSITDDGVEIQGSALFDSLTVAENVAFPLRESGVKDEKEIADRVASIDQDRVHWTGTPQELQQTQDPVLRAFIEGDSGEPWD